MSQHPGPHGQTGGSHPSAPPPPGGFGQPRSSLSEWWKDAPGFSCLGFEVPSPQYYQYNYTNSGTGFVGTARGDLNGDGVTSTFEIMGRVQAGALVVSPNILETNPDE